ncbi:GNAT family N-acetyltransferase [Cohnella pontilimi]|uniref:GNAT family N-acetyltransferase n=1 Tax=Cohnella pontilimi TaxID=2564100 RepID=A0A4U0FHY0_9BACL|nr:GNAT family N-acetyltransferase [Cohnella pontilimi]TJY44548.1 GNAT family N-acetyltransferase [Cohnella pontilimi]
MIYLDSLEGINATQLDTGFFHGWPSPPPIHKFYEILKNSTFICLALDTDTKQVVGFINALSDKILTAYIPLLEVIPEYQGKGIGTELVLRMKEQLKDFYMIDLLCDENTQEFYSHIGMIRATGMMIRNYNNQSGK